MRTVTVHIAGREYSVIIGRGVRSQMAEMIRSLSGVCRVALIADANVARLHLDSLLDALDSPATVLRFEPGEARKSLAEAGRLYDGLADARIGREDLVITFGGGVAGDLGGFVAATWMRGIRFVQVPTTLEAAVDASIGGKTAVNHAAGKNLIGAFHQPSGVLIDTGFLETLPQRDFTAGLAESIKHALIRDPALLAWHESNAEAIVARRVDVLAELIAANCEIKADVVACDEREADLRMILNFGHTVGHAIENLFQYKLRHGECVDLGMLVANELASSRGMLAAEIARRAADLLERLGLPVRLPHPVKAADVIATCLMDKKVRDGRVQFMLLRGLAAIERVSDVTPDEIAAALHVIAPR